MEIRKYHGRRTDGGLTEVGAKDTCVSKKHVETYITQFCSARVVLFHHRTLHLHNMCISDQILPGHVRRETTKLFTQWLNNLMKKRKNRLSSEQKLFLQTLLRLDMKKKITFKRTECHICIGSHN